MNKGTGLLILGGAMLVGAATLFLSPILTKNVVFLAILPVAAATFLVLTLNNRHLFIFILMTRSLMDPFLEKTRIGGGGGIGGLLNVFVIVMVLVMVLKRPGVLKSNRTFLLWGLFLGCVGISVLYSPLPTAGFKLFLNFLTYVSLFIAPFYIVRDEADGKFWLKLLFISSFAPVAAAFIGVFVQVPMLYSYGRLQGTFTHANILAFYIVLVTTLTFYILRTRAIQLGPGQRFFAWVFMLMLLVILVKTETRSAWMSFAVFCIIFGVFKDRKTFLVCLLGGALLMALPPVQERLKELTEGTGVRRSEKLNSWAWRVRLWESAIPNIQKSPVLGHGLASFEHDSKVFFDLELGRGAPAHNVYIELLYEAGLLGLLSYLAIFFSMMRQFFRRIHHRDYLRSIEGMIFFSYVIGYMMVCVSDNALYYLAFNWYFWFLCGLMIYRMRLDEARTSPSVSAPV